MAKRQSGLTPVEFSSFGGLDLRQDPQETKGCIDALNVDLSQPGIVRTRYGTTALVTGAGNITALHDWRRKGYLVYQTSTNIYVVDVSAFTGGGNTATTNTIQGSVPFGAYLYTGSTSAGLKKLSTAGAYTAVGGTSPATAYSVTVQTPGQRMVVTEVDKVWFSDPGDPTTFGANNYVTFSTGSGVIPQVVSWNDLVFAFEADRFFVFYGNSTDTTGQPVFNYRKVSDSIGAGRQNNIGETSAVAADDGVYFYNNDGVYRTTGGPPEKISDPLDPLFRGETPVYFTFYATNWIPGKILSVGREIIIFGGASPEAFAYNRDTKLWTHHVYGTSNLYCCVRAWESSSKFVERLALAFQSSAAITITSPTASMANSSYYRAGFVNPGKPGVESVIREWLIDGTGTITLKTAVDDTATLSSGNSVTLGTSPAVARGRNRTAIKGTNFSYQIGAGSGSWSVSRLIGNLRGQRETGPES